MTGQCRSHLYTPLLLSVFEEESVYNFVKGRHYQPWTWCQNGELFLKKKVRQFFVPIIVKHHPYEIQSACIIVLGIIVYYTG